MDLESNRISQYTYSECKTANGQLLEFTCHPDNVSTVAGFIGTNIRSIDIPSTKRANVEHGGYGRYTRYNITQHEYAGGSRGFIEVIEITQPPDGRAGIVVYNYNCDDNSHFTEWETLGDAKKAYNSYWSASDALAGFEKLPGFKRKVNCGALSPWFYAVVYVVLIGDYTFPEGLQNDPVYRFGSKFIASDNEGIPSIKTCMGCRFVEREKSGYSRDIERFRLVYWNDGSVWDERNQYPYWSSKGVFYTPRPIKDSELWIVEAMTQFQILLSGDKSEFSIDFTDGNKFVGKLIKSNPQSACASGNYCLSVIVKGQKDPVEGWVHDFVPTPETPDIISYAKVNYAKVGKEIERIEITDSKVLSGGKKWAGVYFGK